MFLSTLQTSPSNFTAQDHGISMEKTALETELSYLPDFDASNLTIETSGDNIIVEGAVKSNTELARVLRTAHEVVGYDRVMSRIIVVGGLAA